MRISSALLLASPAAAPRTPAAIFRISRQRACSRSKRARSALGSPPSIATSDTAGTCGAVVAGAAPCRAAWTLASIAARNRGTEIRPAR